MSEWYDAKNDTTGNTFESPGEVELRAGADTLVTANRASVSVERDSGGALVNISLRAEIDRSQLLRLWKADSRVPLSKQDLIRMPADIPADVMFSAEPALLKRVEAANPQDSAAAVVLTGDDGFPLCFDVANYHVDSVSVRGTGSR